MTRRPALAFVLAAVAACACMPARGAAPATDAALHGAWQTLKLRKEGQLLPEERIQTLKWLVRPASIRMWVAGQDVAESDYATDAAAKPATIDLKFQGHATLGIYKLDGDRLTFCLNEVEKGRPTTFDTAGGATLIELRRIKFRGTPLFTIDPDGKNFRQLPLDPFFTASGSPDASRDGTRLAWDAWCSIMGETFRTAHIVVAAVDGTGLKDLGEGAMPSWSPDGKQIAFSFYGDRQGQGRGVYVMDADGTHRRNIDSQGWAAEWSPKKNEVAYTTYGLQGMNLCVQNVDTGERRYLLEKKYGTIWWGLAWSPDGTQLCYRAESANGHNELAVVSAEGETKGLTVLLSSEKQPEVASIRTCLAWGGPEKQILVSMKGKDDKTTQLYLVDPAGQRPPRRLPGLDPARGYNDACWSADGKRILVVSSALEER